MGLTDRTGQIRNAWHTAIALSPSDGRRVWHVAVANIVAGVAETILLVIITGLADALITGKDDVALPGVHIAATTSIAIAGAALVVRVVAATVGANAASRLGHNVLLNCRQELVQAYLYSTWENRTSRPLGTTQFHIGNLAERTGDVAAMIAAMVGTATLLASFVVGAFIVHPLATIGIVIGGIGLLSGLRPITRKTRQAAESMTRATQVVGEDVTELETLTLEVEAFGVEQPEIDRIQPSIRLATDEFRKARFFLFAVPQYFQAAALAMLLVALSVLLAIASDSTASIGAAVLLLIRSLSLAQILVHNNQRLNELIPQMHTGVDQLERDRANARPTPSNVVERVLPLEFHAVGYDYPGATGDEAALRDIDCVLRSGESIGVIGPSGAGKSTLVLMILGVIRPTRGSITANGTPILGDDDAGVPARAVSIVPQSPVLLRGTVADNVRFYRDFNDDEVTRALDQVGLLDELGPDALALRLEPGGSGISGGQRQRLSIARAIISRPEVLVLDEPTSALDTISEQRVQGVLDALRTTTALVIVAHRMSTVQSCDRLLVMDNGRIVDEGSVAQLEQTSSFYRRATKQLSAD